MKHIYYLGLIFLLILSLGGCDSGKQSTVEGKLVNWTGDPVVGVKITASQVQPIEGYEQFEAVTKSDGSFRIKGLFPSSLYVLKPWSEKWTSETAAQIESAPQGETAIMPAAMVIIRAYSKSGGSVVYNLVSGATRMTVSTDGVITDSKTGLEWLVGPNYDINYTKGKQWVDDSNVAGGNWRMPTRQELATLYEKGTGNRNMDPTFKTTGWFVWAEPYDDPSAWMSWLFLFPDGSERKLPRGVSSLSTRVFGVRSH